MPKSESDVRGSELKATKEKLAEVVATLRELKQRLAGQAGGLSHKTIVAELAPDLEAAAAHRGGGDSRLRERFAEMERDNSRMTIEFVAVQEQNSKLASLYAALARLSGTLSRREVLAAIQEIVVNMVGCEELALFELTADGRRLAPTHAFGIDWGHLTEVPLGSGPIGRAAAEGKVFLASEKGTAASWQEAHLTACVPLKLGDEVTGALVFFQLLGHKPGLTVLDREIFDLLERYAGPALRLAAVHERLAARR